MKNMENYKITLSMIKFSGYLFKAEKAVIAQSACVGIYQHTSWIYAVRRECKYNAGRTCDNVCSNTKMRDQDSQIASLRYTFLNYKYNVI